MSGLINYFANKIENLTFAEKHIFYYINSNLDKVKTISLTKLAEENNVSTTTIVRMCTKLGVSGFSELKYIIKDISNKENLQINNFVDIFRQNINLLLNNLPIDDINKLVEMIKEAKKVVIVSVGLSKPIGEYFSKLLMQVNKSSFYVYESHIIDLLDKTSSFDDLIIFISNSGETTTLINIADKLSYKNFKTAAIINSVGSQLANLVSVSINIYTNQSTMYGYDTTARSTILMILDIIFNYYLQN